MRYVSTRCLPGDPSPYISVSEAIIKGIADDGGLYVPERIPAVSETGKSLNDLIELNYRELAVEILSPYLTDFTHGVISRCVSGAYGGNFDAPDIAPLMRVKNTDLFFLELFHGRTLAFKDVALSLLPSLLKMSAEKTNHKKRTLILTATSGDTGKAALEGFAGGRSDRDCEIAVFFPEKGV